MNNMVLWGAAAVALVAAMPAAAQDMGSRQTREFVAAASQSDRFEILEAQTVLGQSRDPQVRAFAQAMIRDHERTGQALRQATASAGLPPPPPGISADQGALLGALQGQSGPEFDHTYLRQQALAHRSALLTEQLYAKGGDVAAIRQAAASAVPIVSGHLAMAERMQVAMGGA